ncbi:MAG: glycosyltransferase family 2 protein [Candidatus Heimdallarchaeum aukensis]|uniref:Glycosyltransferase family 2 protein n=1 Tax=Candidatus Heimdallarchaeum aukensis TaxID=2876573 RepID=A0A9Y1FLN2_9ARCH|nr:MAG: glycosyltransferase family 2 protein [Candidatus Heimdallarchaeum aukensis]
MENNILKRIGIFSSAFSLLLIAVIVFSFVIRKIILMIIIWFNRIFESSRIPILSIFIISLTILLTFGIIIFILGEFYDFFFRKYPSLLLDKKEYSLTESDKKKISVIIPAYNEEKTIEKAIKSVKPYCNNIIVVNDGSTDDTAAIAQKNDVVLINHKLNMGLGTSLRDGINKAIDLNSEIIINFDADLQYVAEEIEYMVYYIIHEKYDLIMGSRLKGKIEKMSLIKKFGNKLYTRLLRYLTRLGISDGQTGFRAFTSDFARKIMIRGDYTYTQEMILEAAACKAKIGEVPISFNKRKYGKSRLMRNPLHFATSSGIFILKVLIDLNPLKIYTLFSVFLFLTGFFVGGTEILDWLITSTLTNPSLIILGIIIMMTALIINSIALLFASTKR